MQSNRITKSLTGLKVENKKAFVPFNVLGYPDYDQCLKSISALIEGGATILELGIPFSDPLADGPIIQQASHRVLEQGFTVQESLKLVKEIRKIHKDIPINILTYYNLALAKSPLSFFSALKEAGVDGITFVDLPVEEFDEIYTDLKSCHLIPIMLISPLTPPKRMKKILSYAEGFVYLVSRAGITGLHESFETTLSNSISQIKNISSIPVLIGFGISNKESAVKMINLGADGVITGTRIVDIISNTPQDKIAKELIDFETNMIEAINSDSVDSKILVASASTASV